MASLSLMIYEPATATGHVVDRLTARSIQVVTGQFFVLATFVNAANKP